MLAPTAFGFCVALSTSGFLCARLCAAARRWYVLDVRKRSSFAQHFVPRLVVAFLCIQSWFGHYSWAVRGGQSESFVVICAYCARTNVESLLECRLQVVCAHSVKHRRCYCGVVVVILVVILVVVVVVVVVVVLFLFFCLRRLFL